MTTNNTYTKTTTEISDEELKHVNGGFSQNFDGTYDFEKDDVFRDNIDRLYVIKQNCHDFKGLVYFDVYRTMINNAEYYESGDMKPESFVNCGYTYLGKKDNCGYKF